MFKASQNAQKYIPGLNSRPEHVPQEPVIPKNQIPKDIPPELVRDFKNGAKNAVSALNEFCALKRRTLDIREVAVEVHTLGVSFASQCSVDGKQFPQGVGKTKKEAKTNAAHIALSILLGLKSHHDHEDNAGGSVMFDSMGRKIMLGGGNERAKCVTAPFTTQAETKAAAEGTMQKTPVQQLQEYCSQRRVPFNIEVSDSPGPFGFEASVYIDEDLIAKETARTKKDAKNKAVGEALSLLKQNQNSSTAPKIIEEDRIGQLSFKVLNEKLKDVPSMARSKISLAAFLIKRGDSEGQVVAFGTGNCCISKDSLTTDGRCLIDSYAIAMARRALLKYFFKEIKSYWEGSKILSIFEQISEESRMLKLKDHISLHLFLTDPPTGDYGYYAENRPCTPLPEEKHELVLQGAHFPKFAEDLPGWFNTKNEDGEVLPVEEDQPPQQTMASLSGDNQLLVMTCSDKLLLWNIVGVQGALFSNFILPTYITSITVAQQFDHGHFSRAVCCRVYDMLENDLPKDKGYHINHPVLTTLSTPYEHHDDTLSHLCMNWCLDEYDKVEVIDGLEGRTDDISPHKSGATKASRLCKAGFLHRFKELAKMTLQNHLLQVPNYAAAKQMNKSYQCAKQAFRKHCYNIGLGNWVRKPAEVDMFVK